MHRFYSALALALLASPVVAGCAHDPLDDKSGEEDFSGAKAEAIDAEGKPLHHTARTERQEADLKKEEDELDQVQFHFNEEREALGTDKLELKEVLAAQHQRDLVLGRRSNTGPPSDLAPASHGSSSSSDSPSSDSAASPSSSDSGDSGTTVVHHKKKKSSDGNSQ